MKLLLIALLGILPVSALAGESFFGVGIVISKEETKVVVEDLLPGGPAEKSGQIKAGDEIVSVKPLDSSPIWTPVASLSMEEIVGMIRGEEGTMVGIHLGNRSEQYEVFLKREEIAVP